MAFTKVVGAGIHTLSNIASHNINSSGIITATKFVGPFDGTNGDFSGDVTIDGNLTVNGTTTTLDTNLIDVDKIEVTTAGNNVAVAITHNGAGDLVRLYDGTVQKVTVDSEGKIELNNPAQQSGRLTIKGTNSNGSTCYAITNSGKALEGIDITCTTVGDGNYGGAISLGCGGNGRSAIAAVQSGSDDDVNGLAFFTHSSNVGADNTAERLRIDSSGRVLIGGASNSASSHADELQVINTSAEGGISIINGDSSMGHIYFGDTSGTAQGRIDYNHAGNYMRFYTADDERLRINSDGDVLINTTTTPTADIKLLVSGNGGVSSGSYFSFRGDYANIPEPAAYAIKYDSSINRLHQYAYGGIAFNLGGQPRVTFIQNGSVGIGTTNPQKQLEIHGNADTCLRIVSSSNGVASLQLGDADDHVKGAITFKSNDNSLRIRGHNNDDRIIITSTGEVGIGITNPAEKFEVKSGSIGLIGGGSYKIDTHPLVSYASFTDISGGTYAARLGSTGTSTIRSTQIYGGGGHIATFDGVNKRLGINTTVPQARLHVVGGTASGTAYDAAVFAGGQNSTSGSGVKLYLTGCENDPLSRGVILESIMTDNANAHRFSIKVSGSSAAPTEKLRLTSLGQLCLTGTTSGVDTTPPINGFNAYYETDQGQVTLGSYSGGGATHIAFYTNEGGNPMSQKMCLQYDGRLGLGIDTPVAGDLKTGDAQNHPKFHIKGTAGAGTTFSDESSTGGEYNLLARFEAGGDADNTGSMIVLNHSNDRGLAIQGGRSTGNKSFGAIKSIDNIGRLTNVMAFGGDNGQGVEYLSFYTGNSTTTDERLRIDSVGRVSIGDNTTQTAYPFYVAKDLNTGGNLLSFGNTDSTYSQGLTLSFDSNKDVKWAGGSGSGGLIWDMGTRGYSFKIGGTEKLSITNNRLRVVTNNGYVDIGPQNSSFCHINTDRAKFYLNSATDVNGHLAPYGGGTHDLGGNGNAWRNIYGGTLNLSSYATVGAIVAADPGSGYYAHNNRIGGGLAVVGKINLYNGDLQMHKGNFSLTSETDAEVPGASAGYQVISGYKTFSASNTYVNLAYVGHSHSIQIQYMCIENDDTSKGGSHGEIFFHTTYGNSQQGIGQQAHTNAMNGGRITSGVSFQYQNSGASTHGGSYILKAKVSYTGDDNFKLYYTIKGISAGNMYV